MGHNRLGLLAIRNQAKILDRNQLDDILESWPEPSPVGAGGQKFLPPIRFGQLSRALSVPEVGWIEARSRRQGPQSRMKKLLLVAALAVPLPLTAQSGSTLAPYVSTDASVSGTPVLLGATYSREYGWTALRFGAGVDAGTTFGAPPDDGGDPSLGVFAGDMDALLYAGSPAAPSATVIPYLLAGIGVQALRGAAGSAMGASWSYGGGIRTPITSWLTLDGEARYRQPFAVDLFTVPDEVGSGLEFRFSASVRTSGRRARVRVPPASTLARLPSSSARAPAGSVAAARFRIAERALDTADNHIGVRYTWGGNTPEEGFDCSGFVRYVFASEGIHLPRVSHEQARTGSALPLDLAVFEPGDLLAFASRGRSVSHIAIYAGNGRIIHSSSSGNGVRIDDLYSSRGRWYLDHMVSARRVIDGMPSRWLSAR
jgi:cell wall-associated NlpC family hydrolase